ncbi:hypothetical protein C1645_814820 [Glomus cerebriforme]|uniref:Cupredoxin n=1 Tax=Glomus cerebriforme TaxID=658196 RepID=A0A397TP25_9GLOM|nr:hypothetical protein C1645_814820 [Glomus cerebriforme]
MEKNIFVLLTMLAFFTLQVLAQFPRCKSDITIGPFESFTTVIVGDGFFSPDCLTVHMGTTIIFEYQGNTNHTVTSTNGPFGNCNQRALSPEIDVTLNNDNSTYIFYPQGRGTLFYKCNILGHCERDGMFGKVLVI